MGAGGYSGLMPPADNKARFTFPRAENEYNYYYGLDEDNQVNDKTGGIADHPYTGQPWKVELERKHVADGDSLRSRFTYEGLPSYDPATGNFSMETYVDDVLAPTALVGNPFMSHLDLRTFQQANAAMITSDFYIWADNASGGFFEAVKLLSGMDHLSTLAGNATIPPMQSFIVVKQPDPATFGSLAITPAMAMTSPKSKLRAATTGESVNIELSSLSNRESAITLLLREGMPNDFHKEKDQYTLFLAEETSIILYAITEEQGEKRGVSIHTVGEIHRPVPLAVRTSKKGELLTLKANGLNEWEEGITLYLEDTEKRVMQNLKRNPQYTFTNLSGNIPEGRFYLRMIEHHTSLEETEEGNDFYMYTDRCQVNIHSQGDPVKQVRVYNLQGQPLEYIPGIHEETFSFRLRDCQEQIVIIQVQTQHNLLIKKMLIKP